VSIFTRRRDHEPPAQHPVEIADRAEILNAERAKAEMARRAVASSEVSIETEAVRLRDSREIAASLREHVRQNGFTEKLAASMRLREKGV
jgi:hypothetical protein